MKRCFWMLTVLAALGMLLGLSACSEGKGEGTAYQVYFLAEEVGDPHALMSETRVVPAGTNPIDYLLDALLNGPTKENLQRIIPAKVSLRSWTFRNGVLQVDFSGRYGSLSGINLTLADYSVVHTLSQVEGVKAVQITADGETIRYRDHQELLTEDTWGVVFQDETE